MNARKVVAHFEIPGRLVAIEPFGSGHINATFLAHTDVGGEAARFVLQRVNGEVFPDPVALMENWVRVAEHLRTRKASRSEGDLERCCVVPVRARDGRAYHIDADGALWRALPFIERSRSYDTVESAASVFEAARAFGAFASDLSDVPGAPLHVTIESFHDLGLRFEALNDAVAANPHDRAETVGTEIDRLTRWFDTLDRSLLDCGADALPRRTFHHDCKINNILFDEATDEALCVIDLDTVMAGTVLSDFGELVRTATCRAPEDEINLAAMQLDCDLYEALARGYLIGAAEFLTAAELEALPLAGPALSLMNALRFLTDFILCDVYFRVQHEGHNLERARAQLRMVELLYEHLDRARVTLVPGAEKSIFCKCFLREFRLLVVLPKKAGRANQNFVLIGQLHFRTGHWDANRSDAPGIERRVSARQSAGFTHAPTFTDVDTNSLIPFQCQGRDWCAARSNTACVCEAESGTNLLGNRFADKRNFQHDRQFGWRHLGMYRRLKLHPKSGHGNKHSGSCVLQIAFESVQTVDKEALTSRVNRRPLSTSALRNMRQR